MRVVLTIIVYTFSLVLCSTVYAQSHPPANFHLSIPGYNNANLFRLDYSAGCQDKGLELLELTLAWEASEYPPSHPNYDPADEVTYTWCALIDSFYVGGSTVKVTRTLPSDSDGLESSITLRGDVLYDLLWKDGIPAHLRSDSLIVEVNWFVMATNQYGLTTYSDTAGISTRMINGLQPAPPLVVSVNRAAEFSGTLPYTPQENQQLKINADAPEDIEIVWNPAEDANITAGTQLSILKHYNPVNHMWETRTGFTGEPYHPIDTIDYQWVGTVADVYPPNSNVEGRTIVVNPWQAHGLVLRQADIDFLFGGLSESDAPDSIRITSCVYARDMQAHGTPPAGTSGLVQFRYNEGSWNSLGEAARQDTAEHSEFGCAPHITFGGCWDFTIYRENTLGSGEIAAAPRTTSINVHPNPVAEEMIVDVRLESGTEIELALYDMLGRRVATLAEGFRSAGNHAFTWNRFSLSQNVAPGMYLLSLRTGSTQLSKMIAFE